MKRFDRQIDRGNYYRATADTWRPAPVDDVFAPVDVAVIGGGFTGVAAALRCAELGLSVTLYEAEHIGFGASGRNGGQLIPGLRWSASELAEELGKDVAAHLFDLCWRQNRVAARIEQHDIQCDLKWGHVEAAWRPADMNEMMNEAEYLAKYHHYPTDILDRSALSEHIQTPLYAGGIYDPAGGHFHPLNYLIGLAKAAERAGVKIAENCPVQPEQVRAQHIIMATDSWTDENLPRLAGYSVPILNYNVATAPLDNPAQLLPSDAACSDSRFVLNYYRLSADGRLIFGGGERYSHRPPADIAAFVRPYIAKVFPKLNDVSIEYGWGGTVSVTLNRLPHIGRQDHILFAHGFSGHGAMITTLVGEILAEAIAGTASRFDIFANLPHRSFPGGALLRHPLAILGMFSYALRDRLG